MTVRNLSDYREEVFVGAFIEAVPVGCEQSGELGTVVSIKRGGKQTVEVEVPITCDPNVATPGKYTLNVGGFAFPNGGADLDESNNVATTTARLRLS